MPGQAVINAVGKFRDDLSDQICTRWRTNWARPLADAQETAWQNVKSAMGAQAELEKKKIEFALAILGIVGGNVASAVFGATALRSVAKQAALEIVVRQNMERAFKVLAAADASALAKFTLGAVWDASGKYVSESVKARLQGKVAKQYASMMAFAREPWKFRSALLNFVDDNQTTLGKAAADLQDLGSHTDTDRMNALTALRASPFMFPPGKPNQSKLEIDIELTLWMNWLLTTDKLVQTLTVDHPFRSGQPHLLSRRDIKRSPSARNYPRSHLEVHGHATTATLVRYQSIGSKLNARIDLLHKKRFGKEFFKDGLIFNERNSRDVLIRAERTLRSLGSRNRWKIG
jgi:hypothetical protein